MLLPRRHCLLAAAAMLAWPAARATPEATLAAILAFTGGRAPRDGRVGLEIAPLVDNGNLVPVTLSVESPMTEASHVQKLALFTTANPLPEVVVFHLGPANGASAGRVRVATRMRLATSQPLFAVALLNDGSAWQARADVIVTLAACIES